MRILRLTILLMGLLVDLSRQAPHQINLPCMWKMVNDIRTNPRPYANRIKCLILDKIDANGLHTEWRLRYNEGKVAVQEAINYLQSANPVGSLALDEGLVRAAYDHSVWQNENSVMQHAGPGGASFADRFQLYNSGSATLAENIVRASTITNTEELVAYAWIIDDGVSSRGHRTNFFSTKYTKTGLGIAPETSGTRDMITQKFAGSALSACTTCPFSSEVRDQISWTAYETYNSGSITCPSPLTDTGCSVAAGGSRSTAPSTIGEPSVAGTKELYSHSTTSGPAPQPGTGGGGSGTDTRTSGQKAVNTGCKVVCVLIGCVAFIFNIFRLKNLIFFC